MHQNSNICPALYAKNSKLLLAGELYVWNSGRATSPVGQVLTGPLFEVIYVASAKESCQHILLNFEIAFIFHFYSAGADLEVEREGGGGLFRELEGFIQKPHPQ